MTVPRFLKIIYCEVIFHENLMFIGRQCSTDGKQFHSFIHYGDLYSAPSRLLLRSAPDPCTAKKKSFETRVECVRKNPGVQSLRQRKSIPHRGANHRECTGLGCGRTNNPCSNERSELRPLVPGVGWQRSRR